VDAVHDTGEGDDEDGDVGVDDVEDGVDEGAHVENRVNNVKENMKYKRR